MSKHVVGSLVAAVAVAAFGLVGCGGEDAQQVGVDSVPPGEECEQGGIVVDVDGEEHYVCDGEDGESPDVETERVDADAQGNPCDTEALKITVEPADGSEPVVDYVCDGASATVDVSPAGPDSECGEAGGVVVEVTESGSDAPDDTATICNGEAGAEVDVEAAPQEDCPEGGIRVRVEGDDGEFGEWMPVCDGESPTVDLERTTPSHPDTTCEFRGVIISVTGADGDVQKTEICEQLPPGAELVAYFPFDPDLFFDASGDPEQFSGFMSIPSGAGFFTHSAWFDDPVGQYGGVEEVGDTDFALFSGWTTKSSPIDDYSDVGMAQVGTDQLEGYANPTIDVGHGLSDEGPTEVEVFFYPDYDPEDDDQEVFGTGLPEIEQQSDIATFSATADVMVDQEDAFSSFFLVGAGSTDSNNEWALSDVFIYATPVDVEE